MSGSFIVSMLAGVTLTTALALMAVRVARRSRAAFRHVLLAASFAVLAALPVAALTVPSISVAIPIVAPSEAIAPAIDLIADVVAPAPPNGAPASTSASSSRALAMPSISALLLGIWIVGAVCCLLPIAVGLWQIRTLRRSALPWLHGESAAARVGAELGVRQRVDVLRHEGVAGPMTCGIVRPIVLFPVDAANWPSDALDRAIVHELEHVRRRDWLSQCVARVICAGYWFHPLVWIARRGFELEAERACDDAVLIRAEAIGYADQLVGLAARLSTADRQPLLAMASRRDLPARVRALLDGRQARGRAGATAIATACLVAAALVLTMSPLRIVTSAQTASGLTFDAASVRPHQDDGVGKRDTHATYGPQSIDFRGLATGYIIGEAYGVPVGHVVGATNEVTSVLRGLEGYDIEARAARPASRDELRSMLQSLLTDRFKLKLHHENRDLQVFRLLPAPGGPKLTPAKAGDLQMTGSSDGFVFRNAEISRLAGLLTSFAGREVVDETGLKGLYDFTLRMPDGFTPASAKAGLATGTGPDAASFAAPLRELGLQLVSGKATVDYLVVDHIERPASNDAAAQTAAPAQRFEAASIRPCQDDTPPPGANGGARSSQGGFPTVSPGRFTIDCGTLERLISNAYVLNGERLTNNQARIGDVSWWKGGPEWIRYDKFTIEASAPGVTDRAILLGPMLRALLEDRFKLKLHRETQDAQLYAMTIAKGGLKIQPMASDGCTQPDDRGDGLDAAAVRAQAAAVNAGTAKPYCGGMTMMGAPGHARWTIGGTTMPNFAGILTTAMDHYVIDKTGYDPDTKFNIHLEFAPDEHVPGADKRNPRTDFAPPDAPLIFAALEQQLGLKLEATKGPQGVLVIDHVERPRADGGWVTPSRAQGPGKGR